MAEQTTQKRGRGRPRSGLTAFQIQRRSDEKRGVASKCFKLKITTYAEIIRCAEQLGISRTQFLEKLVTDYVACNRS